MHSLSGHFYRICQQLAQKQFLISLIDNHKKHDMSMDGKIAPIVHRCRFKNFTENRKPIKNQAQKIPGLRSKIENAHFCVVAEQFYVSFM